MYSPWPNTPTIRRFAASALLLLGGRSAFAQATTSSDSPQLIERVVVTGTYLPDAATVNASPVVTIDRAAIDRTGAPDTLRLLKSLTPLFAGASNAGNEVDLLGLGESYVALRNLPTLVLVDGRRVASSPFTANTSPATIPAVDLNAIPMAMIDRIEILKDSASTIYGSDAIGGVVNVILRKNYNGAEVGARYGTDRNGDYTTRNAWAVAGVATPGFSLTAGVEYFKSTKLSTFDRPLATLNPSDLVALGQNPAVLAAHISSSYPGRNGNYIIAGSPLAVGAPGYNANIKSLPAKTSPTAAARTMSDLIAAGYYIPISDTPLSKAAGGSATILNTALYGFALILPNEREQAFASGTKQIFGKKLEAFGDILLSRSTNDGSDLAPAPVAAVGPSNLTIPANNPYNLFGVAIGAGGVPNAPGLRTRLDEVGRRWSDITVNTYRLLFGLRGEITDAWRWELAGNLDHAGGTQLVHGAANGAVMNQLLIPLLDSTGTKYVYDSQGRPLSVYAVNGKNVPVFDYFGIAGVNAPETVDALRATLTRGAKIEQRSIDLRVTGKVLALPAGDVGVAVGGEARYEETTSWADSVFNAGLALGYIPVANFPHGDRSTQAAFLETHVPLTAPKNAIPLAHRADISAAVRVEHISPGGNATTPKVGLHWMPWNDDLVLRGTYAKGFVAPSIFALYGPAQGAVPTLTILEGNGQTGAGGATGRVVSGQFIPQAAEMSNPALTAAKSESYTYGIVYSPRFAKGLNLSADYYHIKQDKVGGFDYSFIIADLNAKGSASVYAPNFRFVDGTRVTSTAPNQVTSTNAGSLSLMYNPLGDLWTDGVDLGASYRRSTDRFGAFEIGADANVLFNFKARTNPSSAYFQYARVFTEPFNGRGNPQGLLPSYSIRSHLDHVWGRWHSTVRVSYLPKVNAPGTAFGAPVGTPNIFRANLKPYTIPSYATVDLALAYALPDVGPRWARKLTATIGANNVFDRDAPFVPNASGEGNTVKNTYDLIGRFVYVELKKEL